MLLLNRFSVFILQGLRKQLNHNLVLLTCVSSEADTFMASNPVIAWKLIALLALEIVHSHKVHKPGSSQTGPHRIVADNYYYNFAQIPVTFYD